jgi:hypothetical protein
MVRQRHLWIMTRKIGISKTAIRPSGSILNENARAHGQMKDCDTDDKIVISRRQSMGHRLTVFLGTRVWTIVTPLVDSDTSWAPARPHN